MKIVAIVPIKKKSERVKGKNFKKVNNVPLYSILLKKLKKCKFDEIYVDSDSLSVKKFCKEYKYNFIERKPQLAKNNSNGNDLLNYHRSIIKADIYYQLFVTSPLIKIKTINKCIDILKRNKNFDSVFTVNKIYSWFWFKNRPVNYNPKVLPRSQDAQPIVQETTGLYGIRSDVLKKTKCRIGKRPFMYQVSDEEMIDLDNKKDFEYLKFYVKKNPSSTKY
tara:strand:- start:208 stop:870 length:663 start_codon:yes stop_codon:yes gene_type:complete